ncbi:hypothetical protein BD626DRAFT_474937 [Schizophyllum amplum]|uniref:Mediator complex subunit 27 n=1 Tax=Schizophyllum amplum TaxID=97359 RepID=A0A550CY03_9AGAR|nr:hypothetical protein BD626DRAFT_474937 [Auriculariopsis ampla]
MAANIPSAGHTDATNKASALQSQIHALTGLYSQVSGLRQLPAHVLSPAPSFGNPPSATSEDFEQLKAFQAALATAHVQDALKHAQLRDGLGKADVELSRLRRDIRKRRRPPSPESPLPYNAEQQPAEKAVFPRAEGGPLGVSEMAAFVRDFNRTRTSGPVRVHIWTRRREDGQRTLEQAERARPVVLRVTIASVLTAYIAFGVEDDERRTLCVESVAVFGPREKKAPHQQSEFAVFRNLSQQVAKMVQAYPRVACQSLVQAISAYESLFIEQCCRCARVLSTEGHMPPTARVWVDGADGQAGRWVARHVMCRGV